MLPMVAVGWRTFVLSDEEAGHFRIVGVSSLLQAVAFTVDNLTVAE